MFSTFKVQITGAQEWHIVSLLGDVTSPTSAVHYVSMMSDLRVLSTEKHCPVLRQHTVYTNKSLQCKGKVYSSPLNKQGGFVTSQQWMGDLKSFHSVSRFAHPWSSYITCKNSQEVSAQDWIYITLDFLPDQTHRAPDAIPFTHQFTKRRGVATTLSQHDKTINSSGL